jgi:hypothetical protein
MRWIRRSSSAHGLVTAGIWSEPSKADAPFQATHSWLLADTRRLAATSVGNAA